MKKIFKNTVYYNKGFSLIELMVVIAIIGILTTTGLAVFTNAQKQARDGRRRSDIDAIAKSLETRRDQISGLYNPNTGDTIVLFSDRTGFEQGEPIRNTSDDGVFNSYFVSGIRPIDPFNTPTSFDSSGKCTAGINCKYTTIISSDRSSFTTCARLEISNGNVANNGQNDDGKRLTFTSGNTGPFYCKKSQQ